MSSSRSPDGTTDNMGLSRDGYQAYAKQCRHASRDSGRRYVVGQIALGVLPAPQVASVRPNVEWAIFADGSWVGDSTGTSDAFRRRDQEAKALEFVIVSLRKARALHTGGEALREALTRLNASDQEDPDNPAKRIMRKNLQRLIAGPVPNGNSSDDALRQWILDTEAEWVAADQHRRPKVPVVK